MDDSLIRSGRLLRAFLLFFLVSVFGCYPAPKVPMDTLRYDAPAGGHQLLFVYLPGNGDSMRAFEKNGLLQAVRSRKLPADVIAVYAHIGYYENGSVLTRLKLDVIDPAKARGYRYIWLVGNSLGGYGSLHYELRYPHDITGVILFGPYLGGRQTIREITEAGGLQKWEPGSFPEKTQEGWEKDLWKGIKEAAERSCFDDRSRDVDVARDNCPGPIYLGFGTHDRFSDEQRFLAQYLPAGHVFEIGGWHDWHTWKQLWDLILDEVFSP